MGFSIWHLAIVLVVLAIVFGTGKLKSAGKELGTAVKDLKSAFKEEPVKKDNGAGSAS